MTSVDNRTLPKKEHDLFKSVVKLYETKQYKKALKTADLVLKKYPNHGETLAMKGLTLNSLDKKEEGYDLVKKGLRNDVKSQVCWHVFGLLYRSDRNYKEAIKCYLNALRIESDNQNILRDLSWLQIQMRDMFGFVETRRKLLVLKPSIRQQWVAYSVANYTAGLYTTASEIIDTYFKTAVPDLSYETNELMLFQNRCLEKQGKYVEALAHFDAKEKYISDKHAVMIKKAELLTRLGRFGEAKHRWLKLLQQQTENYRFHCGLQIAVLELEPKLAGDMLGLKRLELPCTVLDLSESQLQTLLLLYQHRLSPKSRASNKILLTLHRGAEFESALDSYLKAGLRDGLPALCHDVCALIRKPIDASSVSAATSTAAGNKLYVKDPYDYLHHPTFQLSLSLVEGYVRNLKAFGTFHADPADGDAVEVPTALLWALFLLAHLMEVSGRLTEALAVVEEGIAHTPTALDLYTKKAKILKKSGDLTGAAAVTEQARSLDLQDRYLNNKSTKYLLRANLIESAMDTIALFTRHDGDPQQSLFDLQCVWYEVEAGEAHARRKAPGPALKKFYAIEKHFMDFEEDQFDFHSFSLRKATLRAYVDMLSMVDTVYTHKFFQRAARGAMRTLFSIIDVPVEQEEDGLDLTGLSAAERKKERAKLKKQKKKEEAAKEAAEKEAAKEAAEKEAEEARKAKGTTSVVVKDDDPVGEKLLARDPMEELAKWGGWGSRVAGPAGLGTLCDPDTQALVSEVHLRRDKLILALRSIVCGLGVSPRHPALIVQLVKLCLTAGVHVPGIETRQLKSEVLVDVLREETASLMGGQSVREYIIGLHTLCLDVSSAVPLAFRVAVARSIFLLKSCIEDATSKATLLFEDESLWAGRGLDVAVVVDTAKVLAKEFKFEGVSEGFLVRAKTLFPLANAFGCGSVAAISTPGEDVPEPPQSSGTSGGNLATNIGNSDGQEG